MEKEFAIIMPVYNEGKSIVETVNQIKEKVKGNYCIYAVYDFDEDTTLPFLKEFEGETLKPLKNKYGRGVLKAIKTGFEETREPFVIVFMADLSEDPKFINSLVARSKEGYDIVCGSRYMKGGKQTGGPKFKSFLSRMGGISLRLLTGIPTHDISNSFKLYSRKVLDSVKVESTGGFEVGMEIAVKAYLKGFKITEIPTEWRGRLEGKSNFRFMEWLPKYLKWYFYLIFRKWFGIFKGGQK